MAKDRIVVDGTEYVRANKIIEAEKKEGIVSKGMDYVACRTYSIGTVAGYLKKRDGREVVLVGARRLWSRDGGGVDLFQLAMEGAKSPDECNFSCETHIVILLDVIEIVSCTEIARESIRRAK